VADDGYWLLAAVGWLLAAVGWLLAAGGWLLARGGRCGNMRRKSRLSIIKREREREKEQEEHIILQTMLRPPPATAARAVPRVVLLVVSLSVEDEHLESRVSEMMGNL
jgi:hypothetical protein